MKLNYYQASERAEAQEADRLRGEVKELQKKLTETVKLLGERSRERRAGSVARSEK